MSLEINLSSQRSGPIYRQIAEQIRSQVVDGRLQPGTKLPPIRSLASRLGISKLTVYEAYSYLREAGLLEATVGRGTVVSPILPRAAGAQFLSRITSVGPLNQYEAVSSSIGLRSLASAVPDPELFHADEFLAECLALKDESPWMFYYGPPAGASELLVEVATLLKQRGVTASERELLVTSGSTHGQSLALQALCSTGDTVLVEEPWPLQANDMLRLLGVKVVPVPLERDGLDVEQARALAKLHAPRALITWPNFGAVSGSVMSLEKRKELAGLATEYGFTVLEGEAYSRLALDAEPLPPIGSFGIDKVAVIDSFSYTLSPGLRLGFVAAEPKLRDRMLAIKRGTSVSGCEFMETALARFIKLGRYEAHLSRSLPRYRARRDALVAALRAHMPRGASWTHPAGGFSTWVSLPAGRYEDLYQAALDSGVTFSPGSLLCSRGCASQIRLSFGVLSPEAIQPAVATLARLIGQRMDTAAAAG